MTDIAMDPILSIMMLTPNQTRVTEFVLEGFSEHPTLRFLLIGCFLTLYTMALIGNTVIIALVTSSNGLHSPMYFFLCNLATMDIVCTSSVLPKALLGLVSEENTISFKGCMAQLFFLVWSLSSELLLLTVMAYDRYVAICHPLHYSSRMSPHLCGALALGVWSICALNASINTGLMTRLSFCGPKVITHFFFPFSGHILQTNKLPSIQQPCYITPSGNGKALGSEKPLLPALSATETLLDESHL
ncbi:olfactory receptor 13A1-like protein [Cricetulus griseus]|nr:olfactory receptor 13A1-like protein [Cricetulus griseus]